MRRNFFQRIPFVRISILFIVGLIAGKYLLPNEKVISLVLLSLLITQVFLWSASNYSLVRIQNALIPATLVVCGIFYAVVYNSNAKPEFRGKQYFLAEVLQKPAEKAKTYQTILSVQNRELRDKEKIIAYFDKKSFDSTISTGDRLVILGESQLIKNQENPFEFDYTSMMHRRGIWYSVYLTRPTYLNAGKPVVNMQNWAEKSRDVLVDKLAKVLHNREERSVVCALTLGYRTELDQETLDYFASTGAMHVLSVSGLHVALLFMILGFLLGFVKRSKIGKVIFPVIMIAFLWIYAFISGFSPPVQRATVMFTFVIVGNELRRPVNIYNSLTASALLLILLDPNVIFDVGFQLSYLAIFGIVLIQPALFNMFELKNKSLKWLWALFTVSIAAQLVTFPLGVFYFNQFPNFFWLSNFIVVPVTTFIMWATVAFFILSPISFFANWIGIVIQKLTWSMLESLKLLDAHPLAVTRGLVFSTVQVLLVFGVIFSLVIFFSEKRKIWLTIGLILIISFQLEVMFENYKLLNNRSVIVYNSKNTIIHLVDGRNNYLITNLKEMKEVEAKMVQKVVDHCKLANPIVIDKTKGQHFRNQDLWVEGDSILFLSAKINIERTSGFNSEMLAVRFFPKSAKTATQFISTGYPRREKQNNAVWYTKVDGSCWMSF
jgi:ComEC/Rec2-related protein